MQASSNIFGNGIFGELYSGENCLNLPANPFGGKSLCFWIYRNKTRRMRCVSMYAFTLGGGEEYLPIFEDSFSAETNYVSGNKEFIEKFLTKP